jgi:hypothetical protein
VGIFIRRLVSFECSLFKLYFHLWGGGGPNWRSEFSAFTREEALSWTSNNRTLISAVKKSYI